MLIRREKKNKEVFTAKNRFRYWFDNQMTKGSWGLIRILIAVSVTLALAVAVLIIILGFAEEGEEMSTFWDSIATVINAWMPYFEDGSPGYLVLMSLVAIVGLLFTSVLIGTITSAIEEKIANLKRGNSMVIEKNHIVVLGFYPGEYALLNQLILAASRQPICIVVAGEIEREEMDQSIGENLDIPKNVRIVCRTVDITDPASIEKCSVESSKTIIISPTDDMRTLKAVLAVSALLEKKGMPGISVNAIISKKEFRFPPSMAEANNLTTLQTNNIIAKMIAHSCTQNGLSETFREIFNFEGSEFYLNHFDDIEGISFEDIMMRIQDAVPVGIIRNGKHILNPSPDYILHNDDAIIVFAEECDSAKLMPPMTAVKGSVKSLSIMDEQLTETVIIGYNETLPLILYELPMNVSKVSLFEQQIPVETQGKLEMLASERKIQIEYVQGNPHSETDLIRISQTAEHFVVLNNHEKDAEEADMESIFFLLNLRDIRKRYKLGFNITVEMQKEHNQRLVGGGDHTDFLVASSMSALILAQLAESPGLLNVFREILSNEGNELFLKRADLLGIEGEYTVRELRRILLRHGIILLGFLDAYKNSRYNLPLEERINVSKDDCLIVLSND